MAAKTDEWSEIINTKALSPQVSLRLNLKKSDFSVSL
jgi:hypothetical protein